MDLVFVIPIVHPEGARVTDYKGIEVLLKMTLSSTSAQEGAETATVVVCHELPEWHAEFEKVTFLVLPKHEEFPIHYYNRHIDKSIKIMIGSLFALRHHSPKYIMPIDGDDLFRTDLAKTALSAPSLDDDHSGWIVSRGFNLDLSRNDETVNFHAAYTVSHFHRHCGSCRILRSEILEKVAKKLAPLATSLTAPFSDSGTQAVSDELVSALFADAKEAFENLDAPFRLFGDHMRQSVVFNLKPMPKQLATKTCGHDNHVGPRVGDVHWHRVTGRMENAKFIRLMGLDGVPFVNSVPSPNRPYDTMVRPYIAAADVTLQWLRKKIERKTSGLLNQGR